MLLAESKARNMFISSYVYSTDLMKYSQILDMLDNMYLQKKMYKQTRSLDTYYTISNGHFQFVIC